ncbi:MAG: flagellum-specific ATP synthase FliI, partial [Betaproteobacteria bacterium]|nr:flagellum-specific ATP synthase FliI [Betaproteobacteria bacterium]
MLDFADEVTRTLDRVRALEPQRTGRLIRLVGMTLHAKGLMAPVGA